MAEEKKEDGGDPMDMLWWVLGIMAIIIFFWFATGAYKNTDLRGVFLAPPAPLGPGDAYGPQIGEPNPAYTDPTQPQ